MSSLLGVPLPQDILYPAVLFLGVPLTIIILVLTRKRFVSDNPRFDDQSGVRRRRRLRWTVFVVRTIVVWLLVLALATPLAVQHQVRSGDTHITVLLDNSSSMRLLDSSSVPALIEKLREQVPVSVYTMGSGQTSNLGEGVLSYMKPGENLLLITDGYSNSGPSLLDVASFASQSNSTISAVALSAKTFDAAVSIEAPPKAIADTNTTLVVRLTKTKEESVKLRVTVDDVEIYNDDTDKDEIQLTRPFIAGKHRVVAVIETADALTENNRYDLLLTVVDKPRILVVSQKEGGMNTLLSQLYSVTMATSLPKDLQTLTQYYAVVLVDLPAGAISSSTSALTQYLLEGNGVFVVGGPSSYDYGSYKNAAFESLLPVSVGTGKAQGGVTNIVLALDLSGSVGGTYVLNEDTGKLEFKQSEKPALVRSLASAVLQDLSPNHNVGAIVIGASSANTSQNVRTTGGSAELVQWDYIGGRTTGQVSLLGPKRDSLRAAIESVSGGGQAASQYWIAAPLKALEQAGGSKNIIVFTDGQSCTRNCQASNGGSDEEATLNFVRTAASQGGRVYFVGVKEGINDDFLTLLASEGNGIYFKASEKNKLRILFGDPTQSAGPDSYNVVIINQNHFITRGVNLQANVFGYNQVVPKNYASILATTGTGQPALTVWNYGVGRVASLTVYNGQDYGELLTRGNSLLLSRTGNWLVGDPERKLATVVNVPQMHVGEKATITVNSDKIPVNDQLKFTPRGKGVYEAIFTPLSAGFGTTGGITYAASYPKEYERIGMNPELAGILAVSKGRVFDASSVDDIVEHAQTVRQLQERTYEPLRYPFILLAAIIFLLEIAYRRISEVLRQRA